MTVLRLALLILVAAMTTVGQQSSLEQPPKAPASCPVTLPPAVPFTPPGERKMGPDDDSFWLGTHKLWTSLRKSGEVWAWAPRGPGGPNWTTKLFWGSVDFDYRKKKDYVLRVTGRRLDGDAPPLVVDRVTNALADGYYCMLTGVYAPTPGCWEITADYKGEKLSYVMWLYAVKRANQ